VTQLPLTRDEVVSVIEGRSTSSRVPIQIHFWVHPGTFGEREAAVREILSRYPEDVEIVDFRMPSIYRAPEDDPEYRWMTFDDPYAGGRAEGIAIDERVALADWSRLEEIIGRFPDPAYPALFRDVPNPDGRYRLAKWFFCFYERHWMLRGMSNALTDYCLHPREVHRLFRALTDFYLRIIERARAEQAADGILTGDDLGTQTGPFFSPEVFRDFFLPYYAELIARAHEHGMHFWLHTCGDVGPFVPGWIDAGLDVIHPIQKHAMDEREIARAHGGRVSFWAGLDVQRVIPFGTPDEVRAEVRFLIDTFWRAGEGRLVLTAGNGVNGDCPLESLEAFLDESLLYGAKVASS